MNIAGHPATSKVAEQGQGEGIAHWVYVEVRDKLCEGLPAQEDGAHALSKQGEVREKAGLHQQTVPQENKLDRSW